MKRIILLGATGSIGLQTLDIIALNENDFVLTAFSFGKNIEEAEKILTRFPLVKAVCAQNEGDAALLSVRYPRISFFIGEDGLSELIGQCPADLLVNGLVGFIGLAPTLKALEKGLDVATANKESLVAGGPLIKEALKKYGGRLLPIDSEHVAIRKCLKNSKPDEVHKLILTASGGPFYAKTDLKGIKPEDALRHPTWKMGKRITVDSATMMNKAFELIEAYYLFDMPYEKMEVWIHPTSTVHSLVQFTDGSYMADLGIPDMHVPISYALWGEERHKVNKSPVETPVFSSLTFEKADDKKVLPLLLAKKTIAEAGSFGTVMNAADEVAVNMFLEGRLPFDFIVKVVGDMMNGHAVIPDPTLTELVKTDRETRLATAEYIKEKKWDKF